MRRFALRGPRPGACPGLAAALLFALPAAAEEPKDEFRQTAIPPEVPAAFACWQGGAETLRLEVSPVN